MKILVLAFWKLVTAAESHLQSHQADLGSEQYLVRSKVYTARQQETQGIGTRGITTYFCRPCRCENMGLLYLISALIALRRVAALNVQPHLDAYKGFQVADHVLLRQAGSQRPLISQCEERWR